MYPKQVKTILQKTNQYSRGKSAFTDFLLPEAHGKYIAICEGDDFWIDCHKLQKQFDFMETHPEYSACIHNGVMRYGESGPWVLMERAEVDCDKSAERLIVEGGGRINPTASFFFRSGLLKDYRESRPPVGDHFMLMELASKGKVRWMAKPMSVYRYLADGSWTSRNEVRSVEQIRSYCDRYVGSLKWFDEYTQGRYAEAVRNRMEFQRGNAREEELVSRFCRGEMSCGAVLEKGLSRRALVKALARKYLDRRSFRFCANLFVRVEAARSGLLLRKRDFGNGCMGSGSPD